MDFLFLVEHISRELDAVTCIAERLRRASNASVEIKSYFLDADHVLATYRPAVVIFPFYYGMNSSNTRYWSAWPDATFLNMCWEQMLSRIDITMKVPRDDSARDGVFHFCWTERHRDFLSGNGVAPERLIVTGNPAMKLYDAPYRDFFDTRATLARRHRIDARRKWVLFPEAYQYGFMSDDWMRWIVENQHGDLRLMQEAREYSRHCLDLLLTWANELRLVEDPLFIIRPRPSTPREEARRYLARVLAEPAANIVVLKEESVREWILAADHVISSHSTTLIEAALAEKPVHLFAPVPLPDSLVAEWHELVPSLRTRDGFLDAVRNARGGTGSLELARWARGLLGLNEDPIEAMAQALLHLHRGKVPAGRAGRPDHERLWDPRVVADAARAWRSRRVPEVDHAIEVFSAVDVAHRMSKWRRVLDRDAVA